MGGRLSEAELVRRAQAGDRTALGWLLERYANSLSRYLAPKLPASIRRIYSQEDILQETFAQAHRDIQQFQHRGDGTFLAWLKVIADHRLCDLLRRHQSEKRGGASLLMRGVQLRNSGDLHSLDCVPGDDPSASCRISRQELEQAVRNAVAELPDSYQTAITLHYLDGKSIDDTARVLGRTKCAVRAILDRATRKLRGNLEHQSCDDLSRKSQSPRQQ